MSSRNDSSSEISNSSENNATSTSSTPEKHQNKTIRFVLIHRKRILCRMLTLCKEIAIMTLIAIAYAALTNESPPKVSNAPTAFPFFSRDSTITDWYRGEISSAIEHARASDVSFIMFYAPWNADSMHARAEFERTAHIMSDFVTFSAVNCWQPGSECRKQYPKVFKWPVLVVYPTHGRGIQYNGQIKAEFMVKFLLNICQPFKLGQSINQILQGHDSAIVGHIDFGPGSRDFRIFYSSAMRFLEKDPLRDLNFALLPKKTTDSQLLIYNWNGTISYKAKVWSVNSILEWISRNVHQIVEWVDLPGTKSTNLAELIQPGPAIILFTPKNPIGKFNDLYDAFREVGYEYGNCRANAMTNLRIALLKLERQRNRFQYLKIIEDCRNDITRKSVSNTTECACESSSDKFTSEALKKQLLHKECEIFRLAERLNSAVFERNFNRNNNISDYSCKLNETLNFVAINSIESYHFGEKLGIDFEKTKTRVVIIDAKNDQHYIMNDKNITGENLRFFIRNFTGNRLKRSLQSITTLVGKNSAKNGSVNRVHVKELTSDDFLETILAKNCAVLVFYYSKQCAFCSGISHQFLSVSAFFLHESGLKFARIDGDRNLLPWEYTMESYPAILFIPPNDKSESRVFPQNLPITTPNLINFILANLDWKMKLKCMWHICQKTHFKAEKENCMRSLRLETLLIIGKVLKEWRLVDVLERPKVLYKLQVLRQLHLRFAVLPDEFDKINANFNYLIVNSNHLVGQQNQFFVKTEL